MIIPKVLSADAYSIRALLSGDSVRPAIVSYCLTPTLVRLGVRSWLQTFAFHIDMEWMIFFTPPILLLIISTAVILPITLRASLTNPVDH